MVRIQTIRVDGLFGIFNHEIPMRMEDRITIIHGPNGYGKTTILRLVNALFHGRYSDLRNTPFREFRVDFEDGRHVTVAKLEGNGTSKADAKRRRNRRLIVRLLHGNKELEHIELNSPTQDEWETQAHFPAHAFDQFIPGLVRESREIWRYVPTNEEMTFEDLVDRFSDQLPASVIPRIEKKDIEWLHVLQKSIRVRFIESQRLLRIAHNSRRSPNQYEVSPALELSVAVHANQLAKSIQGKLAEYAALSQSLDRTFPVRLVDQMQSVLTREQVLGTTELRRKLSELEDKRTRLREAGLLDKQEGFGFQVPEDLQDLTQRVLPVYVKDVEQKLSVFDDIAAKIDLLKQIVNSRFSFKKMSIDKENGFVFTTEEGQPLTPAHLSSGEQHMLVLFSELLFRVEPNSLVMIDEPEISLHVTWQKQFLRDLQGVTNLASFDVLIATHSPQIVHDRWDDLTVELKHPSVVEQPV